MPLTAGDIKESGQLLDHLGGLEQDVVGNGEAERLGCLEVDDELKRRRLLYWKIGGLGPFEDLIHVGGGAPPLRGHRYPVRHEAALLRKVSKVRDRRQPTPERQVRDSRPIIAPTTWAGYHHPLSTLPEGEVECGLEIVGPCHL